MQPVHAFLVQEGQGPATFPTAGSTMALFISEDQDKQACISSLSSIGVGQPAVRPGKGAHAHDMV